jgi:DNA-binding IclR family transcriptional regulator
LKSLRKALTILEVLSKSQGIGVRELAQKTGLPPTTVHRIVNTLTEREYLHQNRTSKNYFLSTIFLDFADSVQQQFDLLPISRPHLERLSADTGKSVNLCVRDGAVMVYLDHVQSQKHMLRTFTRLGARVPLYASGVGKIYLSVMKPDELNAYLKEIKLVRFTKKTITGKKRLNQELQRIRKQGYALDDQEKETGVRCIAAPILNYDGSIVAAVSISGAIQGIDDKQIAPLSEFVIRTANEISSELGYH